MCLLVLSNWSVLSELTMFSTAFSVGVEELFGRWEFYRHAQFEIGLSLLSISLVLLLCFYGVGSCGTEMKETRSALSHRDMDSF